MKMKLTTVILCLALASYANSDLLEMSQELWSRVINGGFHRLGRIDPLRVPVIKVDQSEGDTSYRVLLRNLEIIGLNNSKIESVQIVRGRLQSNLSNNEAGYVSYNEANDADSIRYRFHTLIKEPKTNSEEKDLSASENFERFILYDPTDVRAANEDDLLKAGTENEQSRRYYNNFDPSFGARRGYSKEQGEDTVFQFYRQPTYGDMRVTMNSMPKTSSQFRVVYTHNYNNVKGNLPRPCVGACRPNYASNLRTGIQEHPSQPQQYPYGAELRYYQDRVNYNEQTTTPGYGIKAQFGGAQQPQLGIKGSQKGGVQYSANFDGSPQPAEQKSNQFSVSGGNSGLNYNGNYKTGPFVFNAQSKSNYGSTAQPQPQNQFSAKGSHGSRPNYSVDYKKGSFSVQGQSGEGYQTTVYPQNQYSGYLRTGYVENNKNGPYVVNYEGITQEPKQFGVKVDSKPGVSYTFDYRKGPVAIQSQSDDYSYATTSRPQYQYSGKGSSHSTTKQPQNQFSIKESSSGLDYSGRYNAGPFSINTQSGDTYGSTRQSQNQYSVKGNVQSIKYPDEYPSAQNQFPVKNGNQYRGQFGAENNGSASNNYEVKAQAGRINYSGGFNNGEFSIQGGNQRDQLRNRADQSTRYTEETTPQYFEEFEPFKSPLIRLEKQPSYVDIVYASPGKQGVHLRSGKLPIDSNSDPREFGFVEHESSTRYAPYNYTEGESLNNRNDAVRVAAEAGRIEDLSRYAKGYQEEQGYYEEGMELVYHFGNLSNGSIANETLTRTKRQHNNSTEEDDLMHVVVRLRIPQLSLKSNYALTGKVGRRQLRGGGVLSGNFTDVVADFTVELKRVDNKTMIVRAARAKLVSKDRKLRLQGMDENGPLGTVLSHGLMAAEAVAAMIADDLTTKALNEDSNAETMIYKMHRNLPLIEKS